MNILLMAAGSPIGKRQDKKIPTGKICLVWFKGKISSLARISHKDHHEKLARALDIRPTLKNILAGTLKEVPLGAYTYSMSRIFFRRNAVDAQYLTALQPIVCKK